MANDYYARAYDFTPFTRVRSGELDDEFNALLTGLDAVETDMDQRIELPGNFAGDNVIPNQTVENTVVYIDGNGDCTLYSLDDLSGMTPAELLTKLLTVDGAGSGVDADLLDGQEGAYYLAASSYTAADVLTKLLTVDGAASGLDADLLDGQEGAYYLPAGSYTAADVLAKLLTVDGASSGLDADTLDGSEGAAYAKLAGPQTFSGTQTFGLINVTSGGGLQANEAGSGQTLLDFDMDVAGGTDELAVRFGRDTNTTGGARYFFYQADGTGTGPIVLDPEAESITVNANEVWHAGNDGSGSGLDADLIDGLNVWVPGNASGGVAKVGATSGIVEIGRYIDFHDDASDTQDWSCRIDTGGADGDAVQLTRKDAGASSAILFWADPDGAVQLYYAGLRAAATAADGLNVYDTSGSSAYAHFRDDGGTLLADFIATTTDAYVRAVTNSAGVRLEGTSSGSATTSILVGDPDGAATLYYSGDDVLATTASGISVAHPTADAPTIGFYNSASALYGSIAITTTDMTILNAGHGDKILLAAEDTGGTQRTMVSCDPDSGVKLYDGATEVLDCNSTGITILAAGNHIAAGTGSPEGVVTATKGSIYMRSDGGAGTCMYVKETGSGNTGWVANSAGSEGTFTPTWTGFSADPSGDIAYTVQDFGTYSVVTLFPASGFTYSGTSNSTSFSFSGVPTALRPASGDESRNLLLAIDNGSSTDAYFDIDSSGVCTFYKTTGTGYSSTGWTASSSKGIATGQLLSYMIVN